jgi:hypothetical protein
MNDHYDLVAISGQSLEKDVILRKMRPHYGKLRYRGHGCSGDNPDQMKIFTVFFSLTVELSKARWVEFLSEQLGDTAKEAKFRFYIAS